ncbi:MAG: molybdenum cofactor guanylyltransferase [Vicinamibacteria bacterium]
MSTTIGFAVAGGRSRRMGRDKALLPWQGGTLLDHAVSRLGSTCGAVRILSGPERRYEDRGVPVVIDTLADAGPLAGIHSGLAGLGEGNGLFLAVDLPFVTIPLLARLLAIADGFDAVVPVHSGGAEPLCAVYGPACLGPIRRRLEAGERKATTFWPDVRVKVFREDEIAPFGVPAALFRNINTPADWSALSER